MGFKLGDKVIKNEETWIPNDFDGWGRGLGIGEVVERSYGMTDDEVDVRWDGGRCYEFKEQLIKLT